MKTQHLRFKKDETSIQNDCYPYTLEDFLFKQNHQKRILALLVDNKKTIIHIHHSYIKTYSDEVIINIFKNCFETYNLKLSQIKSGHFSSIYPPQKKFSPSLVLLLGLVFLFLGLTGINRHKERKLNVLNEKITLELAIKKTNLKSIQDKNRKLLNVLQEFLAQPGILNTLTLTPNQAELTLKTSMPLSPRDFELSSPHQLIRFDKKTDNTIQTLNLEYKWLD